MGSNGLKGILSGVVAGGIFIIFFFVIKIGLIMAIIFGLLGLIGTGLILPNKQKEIEFIASGLTRDQVDEVIENGKKQVLRIRDLNRKIQKVSVQDEVDGICDTADDIFENFKKDPKDVKAARKFLNYYLDTTERVLSKYVELSQNRYSSEEMDVTLTKVEDTLKMIDSTFKKQLNKLLADDILDLDIELELLEKTIESEGI